MSVECSFDLKVVRRRAYRWSAKRQSLVLLVLVVCASVSALAGEQSQEMKRGDSIGKHLPKLTEKYGKGNASEKSATDALAKTEMVTWKVGDGYLEVETTLGAGIVKDITYVMGDEIDKQRRRLRVKDVDLAKGEMTIVIP